MTFRPLISTNSTPQNYGQINDMIREIKSREITDIRKDREGNRRILLGNGLNAFYGFKLSQKGYDVVNATDDQLVMSSDFNMYKILASGDATLAPRNANITLSGNNIGYQHQVIIKGVVPFTAVGRLSVRVVGRGDSILAGYTTQMDIKGSGNYFDDGTNKAIFDYHYYVSGSDLYIVFNVRLTAGSLTFNPSLSFSGDIYWEICNQTSLPIGGSGSVLPADGKYYYLDKIEYKVDGTIQTALVSSLEEFRGGESNYFPKPLVTIPGYKRP